MSTLAYAQLTTAREDAPPGTSTSATSPGITTYVDALAALVPAEVLALHAAILPVTTTIENGATKITSPVTLGYAFGGLCALAIVLYVGPRLVANKWDWKLDWVRMVIPPFSFLAWTMLQRATAFDAIGKGLDEAPRTVIALFLAVVLGFIAGALAYQADQKPV